MKYIGKKSLPWHGWLVGVILLLFGLASVFDYIMSLSQGVEFYKASGMSEMQIKYFSNLPLWAILAWTVTVWAGLIAALLLLLRVSISPVFFALAFIGNIAYDLYVYVLSEGIEAMGVLWMMPFIITLMTGCMIIYSRKLARKSTRV